MLVAQSLSHLSPRLYPHASTPPTAAQLQGIEYLTMHLGTSDNVENQTREGTGKKQSNHPDKRRMMMMNLMQPSNTVSKSGR
jgi:hypothetical protein